MSNLQVRLVNLSPLRVASLSGFGPNPEDLAFQKLDAWAGPRGLLADPEKHPVFGFNNPDPVAGNPDYGYELWIVVGPEFELAEGDAVRLHNFPGGRYAVTRCEVPEGDAPGLEVIGQTWQKLVAWRDENGYQRGHQQWLEKMVPADLPGIRFVLDLYLPIAERLV
ncbi:MAG: GyrI-like domain-containing protein [Ardenticatenaceae bacterium]|nr:GyrI-like domain-containing protein [Anaerolineales bacterium]MCB8919851.1 GyrI-like domain-containing protein [Ardenticatenaceae bacterium]